MIVVVVVVVVFVCLFVDIGIVVSNVGRYHLVIRPGPRIVILMALSRSLSLNTAHIGRRGCAGLRRPLTVLGAGQERMTMQFSMRRILCPATKNKKKIASNETKERNAPSKAKRHTLHCITIFPSFNPRFLVPVKNKIFFLCKTHRPVYPTSLLPLQTPSSISIDPAHPPLFPPSSSSSQFLFPHSQHV